jgi:hypothetical protein
MAQANKPCKKDKLKVDVCSNTFCGLICETLLTINPFLVLGFADRLL